MKNLLLPNKILAFFIFLMSLCTKAQSVANFVSNGSFEDTVSINNLFFLPKYWNSLDTANYYGVLLRPPFQVPLNGYGFQLPMHEENYLGSTPYYLNNVRGYPRNRLKQNLRAGRAYCVTFFVCLTNQSTHGIDAIGAYFGDITMDTIKYCNIPITYLMPQISNPTNNIISDTLNWIAITGTFVATGNEKYMVIGNYKSNANTNTILTNTTNLPANVAEYYIDAVSCIEADVNAYAGPDKYVLAGDSVYIGRERDFAVDPYCVWYQLPNTTSIDTTSGIWVKPTLTTTYVVQQNLECGSLKWDTVVVRVGYTGLAELSDKWIELSVYPNPASDFIELKIKDEKLKIENCVFEIINSLGQVIREEELVFREGKAIIDTKDLESGVYLITLSSRSLRSVSTDSSFVGMTGTASKRFVVNH